MKKAGFYRVAFGVEAGSQRILDLIEKNIKMEDIVKAFKLCRKVGIETTAFFMIGLPGQKEEDLKDTIRFAKKLKPDIAKFDIMILLPSTPIFEEWRKKGYITSLNWDDYGVYKEKKIYNHPHLSWETMSKYLNKSYRSFYLSPSFISRRIIKSLRDHTLIRDMRTFLSIKW
jgi:anaerobic magnesium-protoporphyrin IX monomethyl ester cyclase